jgi:hypothetical protein
MLLYWVDSGLNSLGNSTFFSTTTVSTPDVYFTNDFNSFIFSAVASITLNSLTRLLPLLSQTQQCHGCSPFSFSDKLISSLGL